MLNKQAIQLRCPNPCAAVRSRGVFPSLARGVKLTTAILALTGCGGSHTMQTPPPVILSVSLGPNAITVPPNGSPVNVPVVVIAPTETVTYQIIGLPAGVSAAYKESESNPSGLLTLVASPTTTPGTYTPKFIVGSSGATAQTTFTLIIPIAVKAAVASNCLNPPIRVSSHRWRNIPAPARSPGQDPPPALSAPRRPPTATPRSYKSS